jgi:uncharacterized protein YegL
VARLEDLVQFAENAPPQLLHALLVDVSAGMSGAPLEQARRAVESLRDYFAALPPDDTQSDVAVVTFGGPPEVVQDFVEAARLEAPLAGAHGESGGIAAVRVAVEAAADLLDARRRMYLDRGTCCLMPFIYLISDGSFGGADAEALEAEGKAILQDLTARRIGVLALAPDGADAERLAPFSRFAPPRLAGIDWEPLL